MTIAVIGHGRSPEGRGWGPRIDACSLVVRMWDNEWQPIDDYGRHYDYGLFVLTPKGLFLFYKHNVRQPTQGWLAYYGKPTPGPLPSNTEVVDTAPWVGLAASMGGAGLSGRLTLTRGCTAAAWALTRAHALGEGRVILVGFDNVCLGVNQPIEDSFSPDYWSLYMSRFKPDTEKVYPIGSAKTATHDMEVELPLLRKLARDNRVGLSLAQEVWR